MCGIVKICLLLAFIGTQTQLYILKAVPQTECNKELVFAQVLFRHGNRTIFHKEYSTFSNDPFQDPKYWPQGFGNLTNIGKRLEYNLGRFFRRRYKKLVGNNYSDVYVRSADSNRCRKSAQYVLAGLFPLSDREKWNEEMHRATIPINTVPLQKDYIVYQKVPCKLIDREIKEYLHSAEHDAFFNKHKQLIKFLAKHTGISFADFRKLRPFYDIHTALDIEHAQGLPLPEWAQYVINNFNDQMEYLTAFDYVVLYSRTIEMQKISAGFLMKEIFDRFKNKTLSLLKPDRKLWLYSVNEHAMVSLLNSMGLFDYQMPPFGSSLHFEMYKCGSKYYVQFFYRRDNSKRLTPLNIPNCGTKCSIDKLYELYANILPKEHETHAFLCSQSNRLHAPFAISTLLAFVTLYKLTF